MPIHKDPDPEDVKLLKFFCTNSEIAALTRVINYDLVEIFRAEDATMQIYTHPEKFSFGFGNRLRQQPLRRATQPSGK